MRRDFLCKGAIIGHPITFATPHSRAPGPPADSLRARRALLRLSSLIAPGPPQTRPRNWAPLRGSAPCHGRVPTNIAATPLRDRACWPRPRGRASALHDVATLAAVNRRRPGSCRPKARPGCPAPQQTWGTGTIPIGSWTKSRPRVARRWRRLELCVVAWTRM